MMRSRCECGLSKALLGSLEFLMLLSGTTVTSAMTIFIADERVKGRRDTCGSSMFLESTKIKRTTLTTTVAELYALMKCFGTCQMLRGLWKDISGMDAEIHIRTDANNSRKQST